MYALTDVHMWGELVPSKIFNPPFPVLKAVSYSCICDVCREWVNEVGFFLKIPVWLVCYAHVFHVHWDEVSGFLSISSWLVCYTYDFPCIYTVEPL